ncbi:hypothetical protein LTS08_008112 [Lithohypha guttulata]|uniref:Uncharacterized protein n=1 Tax=Lithohypha guttulata TaxID=1690604 RepID=A0AAN7T1R2_9EURO|nr:hypothetical protein LTR05_002001 [Lithohypha guttulata]KAK5095470.1 hypothetical protein LTS08_008112 [Lithohypha guttulata]
MQQAVYPFGKELDRSWVERALPEFCEAHVLHKWQENAFTDACTAGFTADFDQTGMWRTGAEQPDVVPGGSYRKDRRVSSATQSDKFSEDGRRTQGGATI